MSAAEFRPEAGGVLVALTSFLHLVTTRTLEGEEGC